MKSFKSFDGTRIVYEQWGQEGAGPWVVLHHGFIADARLNWVLPGVVDALVRAGRRVTALDARSHGGSDKPTEAERCGELNMARDLEALFDLLGEDAIDLVGYSMGAVVALIVASREARIRRLVVGGVGEGVVVCGGVDRRVIDPAELTEALRALDASTIGDPAAAGFRALVDATGADREALIAHCQAVHQSPIALDAIGAPTRVIAGEADPLAVRPEVLVDAIPDATLTRVPGDHQLAVATPKFATTLVDFLGG
ncbi:MAG: alpha/beta hydrolase [Myxococcales bacterium]|nr:alpha/beta hydrolase [Myxococcales bacterium]